MPFYIRNSRVGRRVDCFRSDTDEKRRHFNWVDTDEGLLQVGREDPEKGGFYVKDRYTGKVNPPSDCDRPVAGADLPIGPERPPCQWNNYATRELKFFVEKDSQRFGYDYQNMARLESVVQTVLKKETESMSSLVMPTLDLDVRPHLTAEARKLYDEQLTSTVIEHLRHRETGDVVFPLPFQGNTFKAMLGNDKTYSDYVEKGYERHNALVRFAVKQVTVRGDSLPESVVCRWAAVLNFLAEKGIWTFGTMASCAIPIQAWGDGAPWFSDQEKFLATEVMADADDRKRDRSPQVVTDAAIRDRGRRVLLVTYVGVNPLFVYRNYPTTTMTRFGPYKNEIDEDGTVNALNKLVGNKLFVAEGAAGNDDWSNLPE